MADNTTKYVLVASRLSPSAPTGNSNTEVKSNTDGTTSSREEKMIFAFDVTTRMDTNYSADLSKYPVSSGSEISDHITIRNKKFTVNGVVSNTPFERHPGEVLAEYGTGDDRLSPAFAFLDQCISMRTPMTLYTEFEKVDNVVITGLQFSNESQEAVEFRLDLEQVRFAYARTVQLNVKSGTKKKIDSNKNGGGTTKNQVDTNKYRENRDASINRNNNLNRTSGG